VGFPSPLIPYKPLVERGEPFSRFGQMVFGQLNTIGNEQRSHHELCATRFQHLDRQMETIKEQLGDMYYNEMKLVLVMF